MHQSEGKEHWAFISIYIHGGTQKWLALRFALGSFGTAYSCQASSVATLFALHTLTNTLIRFSLSHGLGLRFNLGRGSRFQISWDFSSATAGLLYVHRGPELVSAFHAIERTITIRLNFIRFSSSTEPPSFFTSSGAPFKPGDWRVFLTTNGVLRFGWDGIQT